MTETERDPRPAGPYRRQPPTIDIGTTDYSSAAETRQEPTSEPSPPTEAVPTPVPDEPLPAEAHIVPGEPVSEPAADVPSAEPVAAAETSRPIEAGTVRSEPARGRGFGSLLAASLVGGAVGAGLTIGAEQFLRQPAPDLPARIAALESRTRNAPTAPAAIDLGPLTSRIAALEAGTKDLSTQLATASAAADTAAKQSAEALGRPAAEPARAPEPDPALKTALDSLGDRLARLEGAAGTAATAESVNEVRARLQTLQTGSEDRLQANAAAVTALQNTAGSLEGRVRSLSDQLGRLPPDLMLAGLRVVAAEQVGNDLRAGRPLGPAIGALGRFGAASATLDPLRPYADKAPPSAAALGAEFKPLAEQITAEPADRTASIGERLMRIADKIVTVKAVGDGTGTDLPGLIGRIEAAIGRGNLSEAASLWDRLPEKAKASSADWAGRLKARAAADDAARRIATESLAALDAPAH